MALNPMEGLRLIVCKEGRCLTACESGPVVHVVDGYEENVWLFGGVGGAGEDGCHY